MKGNRHVHHTAYDLKTDFNNIKGALAEATQDVKGRMGEILLQSLEDLRDKSTDVTDVVADYVAEKPFKSVGIAVLSGFILGILFRRK